MNKSIVTLLLIFSSISITSLSQDIGVSASFFLPRNGYFSAPISPLSIRGVSILGNNTFTIDIGGSLYRMSGMNITGVPFESKEAMVGPFFNLMVPLEAVLHVGNKTTSLLFKGGGFAFYNLGTKRNYGAIDRALRKNLQLEIVNSDFEFDNTLGYGYEFGVEFIQYINRQFGITLGANYYIGGANLNLKGTVKGVDGSGNLYEESVEYGEAKLDYTGLELSVGVLFSSR